MMEVVLLRHAATAFNAQRRYAGVTNPPLSAEGIAQAEAVGGIPGVPLVYVSPLARARQTARLLFPGAAPRVVEGLREMNFGAFEGRTAAEMADDPDYCAWVAGDCIGACPGGESRAGFTRRCADAFAAVVAHAQAEKRQRAVVVAHGGTLMAVMACFSGQERDYFSWHAANCAGWRVWLDAEAFGPAAIFNAVHPVDGPQFLRLPPEFGPQGEVSL